MKTYRAGLWGRLHVMGRIKNRLKSVKRDDATVRITGENVDLDHDFLP